MNTLIIYFSESNGNTEKVARVLANTLNAGLAQPEEVTSDMLANYDLIGFGSGVYFGRFYKKMRNCIKQLPPFENKKAFVFGTYGHYKFPSKPIERQLSRKGFNIVGEFSCLGFDKWFLSRLLGAQNKGKPDELDLKHAESFANSLIEKS